MYLSLYLVTCHMQAQKNNILYVHPDDCRPSLHPCELRLAFFLHNSAVLVHPQQGGCNISRSVVFVYPIPPNHPFHCKTFRDLVKICTALGGSDDIRTVDCQHAQMTADLSALLSSAIAPHDKHTPLLTSSPFRHLECPPSLPMFQDKVSERGHRVLCEHRLRCVWSDHPHHF